MGRLLTFVHCIVYHKSHVGSRLFTSYSEQYIKRFQLFSTSPIARSQAAFLRGLDSKLSHDMIRSRFQHSFVNTSCASMLYNTLLAYGVCAFGALVP